MSLNNTKKQSFIGRQSSYSTHGSRTGANLLGWEEDEKLEIDEQIECLKSRYKYLSQQLLNLPKKHAHRKEIGQEMYAIQNEIRGVKKRVKDTSHNSLGQKILDIIKEEYTPFQWQKLVDKANKRLKENQ